MGWGEQKLSLLCDIFTDGDWVESKNQSSEGVRLIQTGNVGEGVFKDRRDKSRFISEETFSRLKCTEILEGDCLVSRLPEPVGRSCLIPYTGKKMITAVDCTIIRLNKNHLLPEFFNYFTQSYTYLTIIESLTSGATRKRISRKNLGKVPIPLPSKPEQQRIVAILDQAFAGIDKARANAEKNLKNARELFDSYLNQVFSQRGEGWTSSLLKDITSKIGSGATPRGGKESYKIEGTPLIRSMNVHDRNFVEKNIAFIDDEQAGKLDNVIVKKNDILLNITGASVARCCVANEEFLPARVNQHVSIIRVDKTILSPQFLNFLLTSNFYKNQLMVIGDAGSTRQAITKRQIENFTVDYPIQISAQIELLEGFFFLEKQSLKIQKIYKAKLDSLDELKKSLLQKAFSGELTQSKGSAE